MDMSTKAAVALLAGGIGLAAAPAFAADTFYSGGATGVRGTINVAGANKSVLIANLGMSCEGLPREETVSSITNPEPLGVGADNIRVFTQGVNGTSTASSQIQNLNVDIPGLRLSSSSIATRARATCNQDTGEITTGGSFTMQNLMVNGEAVAVTGGSNQRISIPNVATITLNKRKKTTGTDSAEYRVYGVYIQLANPDSPANGTIYTAFSRAKIRCDVD